MFDKTGLYRQIVDFTLSVGSQEAQKSQPLMPHTLSSPAIPMQILANPATLVLLCFPV